MLAATATAALGPARASGCCSTPWATRSAAPSTGPRCRSSCAGSTSTRTPARRVEINPLRVLDDKRPEVQAQLADAPLMIDHLCDACKAHHDEVRGAARRRPACGYVDDPRLVRGLDYYTRTTFEFVHDGLGAQSGIGGGGRYDGLSECSAARPCPASAARSASTAPSSRCEAEGVERRRPAERARGLRRPARGRGPQPCCSVLVTELRRAGVAPTWPTAAGLKGAMKAADRSGARFAVIARRARPGRRCRAGQGPDHRRADRRPLDDLVDDLEGETSQ